MTNNTCNVCGEGKLTRSMRRVPVEYAGTKGEILLHFSACDVCCSEIIDQDQSVCNRREFNVFKKQVDGIPSGAQIRQMRLAAGINQKHAGKLLGGGPTAFSKYENNDLIPDSGMATLLLLLASDPSLVAKIERLKAPRELTLRGNAQLLKNQEQAVAGLWSESYDYEEDFTNVAPSISVASIQDFQTEGRKGVQKANSWMI